MAMLKFDVSHTLSLEDAKQRVGKLLDYWTSKYGVQASWSGDRAKVSGKVMGITIDAHLQIGKQKVEGEATDPGFLFREKAKKYLHEKLAGALDPGKTPDSAIS
jgi:hypothetical protein